MYCPQCGEDVSGRPEQCPSCGAPIGTGTPPQEGGQTPTASREAQTDASGTADRTPAADSSPNRSAHGGGYLAAVSIGGGLARGIGAFVSGLVFTGMIAIFEVFQSLNQAGAGTGNAVEQATRGLALGIAAAGASAAEDAVIVLVKVIGWVFFAAHQVPITQVSGGASAESVNVLARMSTVQGAPITPIVYYAIPPILLTVAGFRVAVAAGALTADRGVAPGASVALGYVPIAVVGASLAAISPGTSVSVGPAPVTAALFAGIYAVGFGSLGGAIGGALADEELVGAT